MSSKTAPDNGRDRDTAAAATKPARAIDDGDLTGPW